MDVSRPSQVAASPTSRPVIVTNRPLITQDPMVAPNKDAAPEASKTSSPKLAATPATPHAEKVIKPLKEAASEAEHEPDTEQSEAVPFHLGSKEAEPEATDEKPEAKPGPPEVETTDDTGGAEAKDEASDTDTDNKDTPAEAESTEPAEDKTDAEEDAEKPADDIVEYDSSEDDKQINPEAVKASTEAQKRNDELEGIIASGKYYVPIDASGKRRTLIITIWLIVLTLVLAVVLVDALLDVGMLTIPGVPHTHFFSVS